MRRRIRLFVAALALSLLTSPLAAEAQEKGKVYRVGVVGVPTR